MTFVSQFRFLVAAPAVLAASAWAQTTATLAGQEAAANSGQIGVAGDMVDGVLVPRTGNAISVTPGLPPLNLGSFDIVINAGATLAGNPDALAAFNRAAAAWEARISDPITVTIAADLGALGGGIIGSASSVILNTGYTTVRNAIVNDAADEADDGIVASLPTAAQFSVVIPGGSTPSANLSATKANFKALGFTGLDAPEYGGPTDATITFSTGFAFDYDHSNGVGAGLIDFETVAAHEIGHALGFMSFVDSVNAGVTPVQLVALDLFRFGNDLGDDPATAGEFTTFPRNLMPGVDAITDEINGATPERRMSTGLVTGLFADTDGRQASHWKDNELPPDSFFIGLMDPTLSSGIAYGPQESDFRALDLIGYDIAPVPEPTSVTAAFGLLGLAGWRFWRRAQARGQA
jgi:hypothetical protein